MRVATKGQVTLPQDIYEKFAIYPAIDVDFIEEKGRVYLVKRKSDTRKRKRFGKLRGISRKIGIVYPECMGR